MPAKFEIYKDTSNGNGQICGVPLEIDPREWIGHSEFG